MLAEAAGEQLERVQVEIEPAPFADGGQRLLIRVESHDKNLGWYTSASMSLPLHQLPLLEQALARTECRMRAPEACCAELIPFPGATGGSPR